MSANIGIVTGSLSPAAGGVFYSLRILANKLAQRGVKTSVYGLIDDQFEQARDRWTVSALHAYPVTGPRKLGFSPAMLRAVESADHDLFHLHGIWSYPSYVVNRWRLGKARPTIISPHGMLDEWAVRRSRAKKRIVRLLYEDRNLCRAGAIHALNRPDARAIRKFGLRNPIAIIPNGVDLPDLGSAAPQRPEFLCGGRKILLFLGRIHPKKGVEELVHAWARVRRLRPAVFDEWMVAIAGWDDGGHQARIEAVVREENVADHVIFTGPICGDKKHAVLRHAGAFILPSYGEGMPMAVLEAWSYGLPIFMTRACNLTEGFDGDAAFEIAAAPEEMARTLAEVLGDSAALRLAGQRGRRLAGLKYSWTTVVDDMIRLYGWLCGFNSKPAFVE
jgi:glycosyltransferase involved in cell wall biosynthesis